MFNKSNTEQIKQNELNKNKRNRLYENEEKRKKFKGKKA